jgi:hypothetical protein
MSCGLGESPTGILTSTIPFSKENLRKTVAEFDRVAEIGEAVTSR